MRPMPCWWRLRSGGGTSVRSPQSRVIGIEGHLADLCDAAVALGEVVQEHLEEERRP